MREVKWGCRGTGPRFGLVNEDELVCVGSVEVRNDRRQGGSTRVRSPRGHMDPERKSQGQWVITKQVTNGSLTGTHFPDVDRTDLDLFSSKLTPVDTPLFLVLD